MKKKLTLKEAIKRKYNPIDCVLYYQKISKDDADYILWNETCYPFSMEEALNQLYKYFKPKKLKTA